MCNARAQSELIWFMDVNADARRDYYAPSSGSTRCRRGVCGVSDSYHYGACPAAPRASHNSLLLLLLRLLRAATCQQCFDATCLALAWIAAPALHVCACFLCLVAETASDFQMNGPRRQGQNAWLPVCQACQP